MQRFVELNNLLRTKFANLLKPSSEDGLPVTEAIEISDCMSNLEEKSKVDRKTDKNDPEDDCLVASASFISKAKQERMKVEWNLKDFYHLNKIYMLNPGPQIIVETGKEIEIPSKWRFSMKKKMCTVNTRYDAWLTTEILEAPKHIDNIVAKFDTEVILDGIKTKEIHGSPVVIPVTRQLSSGGTFRQVRFYDMPSSDNDSTIATVGSRRSDETGINTFNVGWLFDLDSLHSNQNVTLKIIITVYARDTENLTNFGNVRETMEKSANNFSCHFGSLLREAVGGQDEFSDVKLQLKDGPVLHAHRAILASRSPVFRAMFLSKMEECKEGVVHITDISPKAMDIILHHIYTGKVDPSCNQIIEEVIYGANKYHLPDLLEYCDRIMITACTRDNALALLKLAQMHSLKNAISNLKNYITMNSGEILESLIAE